MKIVLDTNVLVSGLLKPYSPAGEIVRMVASGIVLLCHDSRILAEYREVLSRPKFSFNQARVAILLSHVELAGQSVGAFPLKTPLPDPDDEMFLSVALAGGADCLVTGNLRHYPRPRRENMRVLSPVEFIDFYRTGLT